MQMTTVEMAAVMGVEYLEMAGLTRYLEGKGYIKQVGKRPAKNGGKGRQSKIYEVPETITLVFPAPVAGVPAPVEVPVETPTVPVEAPVEVPVEAPVPDANGLTHVSYQG